MILRSLIVAAVLVAFSAPASAFYCPKQGKAITAALAGSGLSAAKKAEVETLRDKGLAEHSGGIHAGAVTALAEATRIILGGGM